MIHMKRVMILAKGHAANAAYWGEPSNEPFITNPKDIIVVYYFDSILL